MATEAKLTISVHAPMTPELVEQILGGEVRVVSPFGDELPHVLTPAQIPIFEEAQKCGYVVTTGTSKAASALANAFFVWSKARDWPSGHVRTKTRYAEISFDFIAVTQATDAMRADAEACVRSYPFAQQWARSAVRGDFSLGTTYWHIVRCPLEHVEGMASRLAQIARSAHPPA